MATEEALEKEREETQLRFRMNKVIEEQIAPALPKIAELKTVNEIDEALGKLVKGLKLPEGWKDTHKFSIERVFKGFKVIFEKADGERIFSGEIPADWVTVEEVAEKALKDGIINASKDKKVTVKNPKITTDENSITVDAEAPKKDDKKKKTK